MDSREAYQVLTQWLLTENSSAAAWLARYPHLLPDQARPGEDRIEGPPPLAGSFDEETAQAELRLWLGRGLVSLGLDAIRGKGRPAATLDRLAGLIAGAVERALVVADLSLRQNFHHPLLLPSSQGPGPVAVLAWGPLAGREAVFNQPVGLFFLFTRSPAFAGPRAEEELAQAREGKRRMIILKEYVLKVAGRVLTFLGLEHPDGPALATAPPEGWPQTMVGPQINSLGRFLDFFQHKADPGQLFSLARMAPLAGDPRLGRHVLVATRKLLLDAFTDRGRTAQALARLRSGEAEGFDPQTSPGGLRDLGLLVDGLLLGGGAWAGRTTGERIKKAAGLGLLAPAEARELSTAHQTLIKACLLCSAMDRKPEDLAQCEAALALWPGRRPVQGTTLREAVGAVSHRLDRFIQGG